MDNRRRIWRIIVVMVGIVASVAGDAPIDIFSFPLNIIVATLWFVSLWLIWRTSSTLRDYLLSREATWTTLLLMAAVGVWLGLEREPNSVRWTVVAAILYILSHLTMVIVRGAKIRENNGKLRWRFLLTHIGLWVALGAGFWGAPDRQQMRMALYEGLPTDQAFTMQSEPVIVKQKLTLQSAEAEYNDKGMPTHYAATIEVDGTVATIEVNKPYNLSWSEKLYLVDMRRDALGVEYIVVEIVREPWQWLTIVGIAMLIAGAVLMFIRGPRHTAVVATNPKPTKTK